MECSWNDGGKTKYYVVIFDQLQSHSRGLIWAPELYVKGSLIFTPPPRLLYLEAMVPDLKRALKSVQQMCLGAAGCFQQYSTTRSGTLTLEVTSQELYSLLKSFHLIRNWNLLWCQQLSNISSTSHSGSPLTTIGGGGACSFLPGIGSSRVADNFTTLNTRCNCLILWGNLRQQANGPTWHLILKGLSLQCDNFGDRCVVLIYDVSRYTQSPGLNTRARDLLQLQQRVMSFCALWIVNLASLVVDCILFVNSLTISRPEGFCLSSKPMREICSVFSRNRGCCVVEQTWLLCWNSMIGRRLYQLSCHLLTNRQRNWLSSWLTCSVCLSVWGCQAVKENSHIPSSLYSSLVNEAINWGPQSETTHFGRLWSFQT